MDTKNSAFLTHWAVVAHLVPFAGAILLRVLQPNQTFEKEHARASFNFHATFFAGLAAVLIPALILQLLVRQKIAVTFFAFLTLLLLLIAIVAGIYALLMIIKNAMRASRKESPSYRFSYPFLK